MAKEQKIVGIDIGTRYIYTVVGVQRDDLPPVIVGIGRSETHGMRRGNIVSPEDVIQGLRDSVKEAETAAGVTISSAFIGVGGDHILSLPSKGVIAVSRVDKQIAEDDVHRVIQATKTVVLPSNREILHAIPNEYVVDDEGGLKDVVGMSGVRLEANALIVGASSAQIRSLKRCINECNIDIKQCVLSVMAASHAVLTNQHKELGVVCIDIGGGTTDIAVFEERELIHASVIPIGGDSITNDLALGLRIPVDSAERIKREHGVATTRGLQREVVDLKPTNKNEKNQVLRKNIATIINARLGEIMDLVNKDLRSVGKEALLPGGAVLVGGTAKIPLLKDLCKEELRLPAHIGVPKETQSNAGALTDPSYAAALGLVFWGAEQQGKHDFGIPTLPQLSFGAMPTSVGKVRNWLRVFLP
ncbi:MAG: cell division protein FtsA [Candidatus Spechtbacteria bacterium SB0662_bin_43]|uniref:Cell division protein FtsA n=1 Tax=Candidatus Spechtbacteria bacterium SB0662_bin_43 TaxID=2604897 RepID=A0A845D9J4_9BACT|nr:cell division protein FtsA [Candidatus Spechtbacteria bacterium SB0662_bin_43]